MRFKELVKEDAGNNELLVKDFADSARAEIADIRTELQSAPTDVAKSVVGRLHKIWYQLSLWGDPAQAAQAQVNAPARPLVAKKPVAPKSKPIDPRQKPLDLDYPTESVELRERDTVANPAITDRVIDAERKKLMQYAEEDIDNILKQIDALENNTKIPATTRLKQLMALQGLLSRAVMDLRNVAKQATKRVDDLLDSIDEADKFVDDLHNVLNSLGFKVQGFKTDNGEFYETSKNDKARLKTAEQFNELFMNNFTTMVHKIVKENAHISKARMVEFLNACNNGTVIDMANLVKTDVGTIYDHVASPDYREMLGVFQRYGVFKWSPGKTSGAIGPGEIALAMMGNPTEKAQGGGDIKVGDTIYEIKAGDSNGGRLNSKSVLKAPAGWKTWSDGINKIVSTSRKQQAWSYIDNKGKEVKTDNKSFSSDTHNPNAKVGWKKASKYNFNVDGLTKLNDEVLAKHSTSAKTLALFTSTFKSLIKDMEQVSKAVNLEKTVGAAINADGTINISAMMNAYIALCYESYKISDGVRVIMFMNTESLDYKICRSGKELIKSIGKDVKISSGFNWNDDQQAASPALLAINKTKQAAKTAKTVAEPKAKVSRAKKVA